MGLLKKWERPGGLCTLAFSPSVSRTLSGRTLSLCPGDEKHHPMQSYQVKHTSHLCITYSQWRHSANNPVTSGCGALCAEGKVPLLYVCTILERLHTQNLCSQGTMTYQWNKWFWTYSQYQEKVLEEEKPSLDAPGSKLQDTTLNSLVSLFPLRLACFQMYWPPHHSLQVKNPLILCPSKPQPKTSDHHRHGDFLFLIEMIKGNGHETIGHQRWEKKTHPI